MRIGHDLWYNSHATQREMGMRIAHSDIAIRKLRYTGKQIQPVKSVIDTGTAVLLRNDEALIVPLK